MLLMILFAMIIDISMIIHTFLTNLTVNHLPKDSKARKFNPALQINDMINHHRQYKKRLQLNETNGEEEKLMKRST